MMHYYRMLMRYIDHLDVQQWLLVLIVTVCIGVFCMRGFGSRSNY